MTSPFFAANLAMVMDDDAEEGEELGSMVDTAVRAAQATRVAVESIGMDKENALRAPATFDIGSDGQGTYVHAFVNT